MAMGDSVLASISTCLSQKVQDKKVDPWNQGFQRSPSLLGEAPGQTNRGVVRLKFSVAVEANGR